MYARVYNIVVPPKGGTEGSLAFGQAYRGALPPLPPGVLTPTSA